MPSIERPFCLDKVLTIASEKCKNDKYISFGIHIRGNTNLKYEVGKEYDVVCILSISKTLSHVDTSCVKKEKRGYDTTFLLIVLRMKLP